LGEVSILLTTERIDGIRHDIEQRQERERPARELTMGHDQARPIDRSPDDEQQV
jgi:hypothetical protein